MTIVTLSLNPTIDIASETDHVRPTSKTRTYNETYDPGGGGVNVARTIRELGGDASVIVPAGGFSGRMLDELLGQIPIPRAIVPIAGNTRIGVTIYERKSGQEYRFIPNGPRLSDAEVAACLDAVRACDCEYFVASGSVPLGAPDDVLAQIGRIAAEKGAKFVLDSSGIGLSGTLAHAPVYLVKPSMSELEALVGRRLDDHGTVEAAQRLIRDGKAEIVAVTMGASGALVVRGDEVHRLWAPPMQARSAVGAGDSFVAAMTLALSQGRNLQDAALYGIAAGAATVLTIGTRLCHAGDVERIYRDLKDHPHGPGAHPGRRHPS